jgi:hypothetical protein
MSKSNGRVLCLMVAVLLAAAFLRLVAWRDAPPGLRYDEMLVVTQTDAIRDGARPIYIDDLAEEPLYHYLFAAAQDLFGEQLFTLRWLSLAPGLIAVAAIFALGRRMFNARVGLLGLNVQPRRPAHHHPARPGHTGDAVFVARPDSRPPRFRRGCAAETSEVL